MQRDLNKRTKKLSGGMKRRLQLVLAFAGNPMMVFMDEATTGCDSFTRELIRKEILEYRSNSCVLFSTHHIDDIEVRNHCIALLCTVVV
jgi:ABC-2 type transport system ATP-binding protein